MVIDLRVDGNAVTLAEANLNGIVRWGRKVQKGMLLGTAKNVWTRY